MLGPSYSLNTAELVGRRWFGDHHRYSAREVDEILGLAAERNAVAVTTAKDAVKLPGSTPCWVVETDMTPVGGSWEELWRQLPEGVR